MIRLFCMAVVLLITLPTFAQQIGAPQQTGAPQRSGIPQRTGVPQGNVGQPQGAPQTANNQPNANAPAARVATRGNTQPIGAPFPPLNAAERAQLTQVLTAWEAQTKSTKTLDCKFTRWHYDLFMAPAGIHANRADGVIKYAAPDKGLFRVDSLVFFSGLQNGKPQFKVQPDQVGEHWVCNGKQLIQFDGVNKQCKIIELPPEMQGQEIINSPLPFVFNLDAQKIQERYWVRLRQPPKNAQGIVLVEAHPKRQEDRAQYKFVQVALDQKTMLPRALLMYAPNFHPKNAVKYDHYEFTDLGRNKTLASIMNFMNNFIPKKPPSDWQIVREDFVAPAPPQNRAAQNPAAQNPSSQNPAMRNSVR
ncbi:MAG: TIGR03009 domain-containing protein [Planctomycetota bacterium]